MTITTTTTTTTTTTKTTTRTTTATTATSTMTMMAKAMSTKASTISVSFRSFSSPEHCVISRSLLFSVASYRRPGRRKLSFDRRYGRGVIKK
jgi:hypothetical protein